MAALATRLASVLVGAAMGILTLRRAAMIVAAMIPRRTTGAVAEPPPSIALIVPALDEEDALPRMLAALERLDYPDERLSVILVDDGSSDRSGELMATWAAEHSRARALSLGERAGKGEALNSALRIAPGTDVVVICDADIRPRPAMLRIIAAAFADPSVGAASAYVVPANAGDGVVADYGALESWVHQLVACTAWGRFGIGPAANGCVAYRSDALESVGGFDGYGPGEDVRLASALSAQGWVARFDDEAIADGDVVSTLSAYLRQHLRWTRNLLTVSGGAMTEGRPREESPAGAASMRGLERRIAAAGYADRLVLAAAFALAAAGRLPRGLPGAYVATLAVDVATAVTKAGRPGEVPRYLGVAAVFSVVDVVASAIAIAAHVGSPAQRWPGTHSNSD